MAGVLIKNAEALEAFEKVDTLLVDKTGTLTDGKPRVVSIETNGQFEESEFLRLAASVEQSSEHPLATALVTKADENGLRLTTCDDFRYLSGQGVAGCVDGRQITLGN